MDFNTITHHKHLASTSINVHSAYPRWLYSILIGAPWNSISLLRNEIRMPCYNTVIHEREKLSRGKYYFSAVTTQNEHTVFGHGCIAGSERHYCFESCYCISKQTTTIESILEYWLPCRVRINVCILTFHNLPHHRGINALTDCYSE